MTCRCCWASCAPRGRSASRRPRRRFSARSASRGLAVKTTDPVTLCVKKAEIDQPGTRETKAIRELSGLASLLTGKDKYAKKTEKYLGGSIVLNGVRYENGRFSAEGIDGNAVATALLTKLSGAMSTKLQ